MNLDLWKHVKRLRQEVHAHIPRHAQESVFLIFNPDILFLSGQKTIYKIKPWLSTKTIFFPVCSLFSLWYLKQNPRHYAGWADNVPPSYIHSPGFTFYLLMFYF